LRFEWDPIKATTNFVKHRVGFDEASTAFADDFGLTVFDPKHSDDEDRFIMIGFSKRGRLLVVWHTDRNDVTRLISARTANQLEKDVYNAARS